MMSSVFYSIDEKRDLIEVVRAIDVTADELQELQDKMSEYFSKVGAYFMFRTKGGKWISVSPALGSTYLCTEPVKYTAM